MKNAHFTKQERFILVWLQFLLFSFLILGALFAFQPMILLQYINNIGLVFFDFRSPPLGEVPFDLWWVLTLSLMAVLIYITFQAQRDWLRYFQFVSIILLTKFVSLVGFLALIFLTPPHFFYLVGAVVEALLFLTTAYVYVKAIKSRNFLEA